VVDPDPAVADLVRRYLDGYEVVHVEDVGQLDEDVMLYHPRAVVCNVPPGECSDAHARLSVSVPFIECSLPSQARVAGDLAVRACLTKPITAERLLHEIDRLGDVHDVLVIDDDWGFCHLITRMLDATDRTLDVRRAYDGEEGLLALRDRRPDVMLLDLVMPDMDGFQVLERMRQEPGLADVPVVLLTATSYVEDALAQRGDQVVIRRQDGLSSADVLHCLRAVVDVLEPRYDERSAPEQILARDV
jgi:CheY-like chemotaxis protein